MGFWQAALWGLLGVGGLAALYGLHRLCLRLEERGWLYYKHKKPSSSAISSFVALQNMLEPPTQHVLQAKEQKRYHGEEEAPGQGHPPDVGPRDHGATLRLPGHPQGGTTSRGRASLPCAPGWRTDHCAW